MFSTIRKEVLNAFDEPCGYYHQWPHKQRNYIDGMFHVAMLHGAAKIAHDTEVMGKCKCYLHNLCKWNVRAYGPDKLTDDWEEVSPGIYGHKKPQSFAGTVALCWGASEIAILYGMAFPYLRAKAITIAAKLVPWAFLHWPLKQHLNSCMLAFFSIGERPAKALHCTAKNNPVYQFICGLPAEEIAYPNIGAWPAKDLYFWDGEESENHYTPLCSLVGAYLGGWKP